MSFFVRYNDQGRITSVSLGSLSSSEIRITSSDDRFEIEVEGNRMDTSLAGTHFIQNDGLVPRPALTGWNITQAPAWLSLADLPLGSQFTITNEAGEQLVLTDFAEPLQISDPGTYQIMVEPPFPYLPHEQQLVLE